MDKGLLQPIESSEPTSPQKTPDPFDLAGLRLNSSFLETAGVKNVWPAPSAIG
jgi:hypothetical protein